MTRKYRAREVFGDEKARWWRRAVDAFPDYADYQRKTGRQIPVFVLEPLSERIYPNRPAPVPVANQHTRPANSA